MKKYLLLLFSMIFISGFSWAQNSQRAKSNNYTFTLNGNEITPSANFEVTKNAMKAKPESKDTKHLGWYIVQFNSIPTQKERKQLKSQGIELLNYIQGNAYFASVTPSFLSSDTKSQSNIRSLIEIKPEYKINKALASGSIPEYAKGSGDNVKVVITYFKDVDESTLESGIPNVRMTDKHFLKNIHQLKTEVSTADLIKIASARWVQSIEMVSPPAETDNRHGKSLHRANVLNSTISGLGYDLTGKGVTIGLWDNDVENHKDFNNRVTNREYEVHSSDHGTHTCGTITGAGLIDPNALGMAPEVKVFSWNFNTQSNGLSVPEEREISLNNDGIEITSNSWSALVSSCPNWLSYDATNQYEDWIACNYPYFLYVWSAGNSQSICSNGYFTTSQNMKNALVVAAVDREDQMSSFSSFGPSYDGRLIPNISGDGVGVYSTMFDNTYATMDGTSMSTPGVAGTMALIYQRYKETHGGQRPISSLMRALACNTAYDLGNPGPDYKYGYGEINGAKAVEVMEQHAYFTDSVAQSDSYQKEITIPADAVAVKVMLAWTDPAGVPYTGVVLVNDLDLYITKGTDTYNAWVLDPYNPSNNAVRGWDKLNNMEQVTIDKPTTGTFTINVDGYAIADGKQEFAVVYDIVMPSLKLTYPIGGEYLTPGDEEVIRWDCDGYDKPFTIEYSKDGGVNYSVVASNIASNIRSYVWTVPTEVTANAKFRISNGSKFNVTNGTFQIMPVPKNVAVGTAQCEGVGPFAMTWDAVPNAKYKVYKLNGQVYEPLAEVPTNSYNITGIVQSNNNWYCVRAIDLTTGAVSERSLAVTINPSVAITSLPFSEDFESQKATNFYFSSVKGQGNVRYVNTTNKYGIRLEGTSGATTDWIASTDATCFTSNSNYVVTASICNLDATSMVGKSLRLKFDFRQKYREAAGTSYFRVKVNGSYLINTDGNQIYGTTDQVSYKSVYYDLSAFAGLSSVNIEFEAVCKTNYTTYVDSYGEYDFSNDTYDIGDFVAIDNIRLYEPENDLSLTALSVGNGGSSAEAITVTVKNLSGSNVSNIPVSYSINRGTAVNETIAGPIEPMAEVTYTFTQKADLSVLGSYTVDASVSWTSDINSANNTQSIMFGNNGTDILMGTGSPTTTCSAVFTDPNGRFGDYDLNQTTTHTFKPGTAGKLMKVTFTEFALENGYDWLYIYDGSSTTNATQIGMYTGSTLPPSITSTASDGALTFKLYSDNIGVDKGFVANLECVDRPNIEATVSAITSPFSKVNLTSTEPVTVTLGNNGLQDLTNINVYYQIGASTPVNEVVPSLASLKSTSYTFTTTADLSAIGDYTIKAWVAVAGDANTANDTITKYVSKAAIMTDAGISAISTKPAKTKFSTIRATITNFSNHAISNFNVAYTVNGGAEVVQNYARSIAAGRPATFDFTTPADLTTAGTTYSIDVYTKLVDDADATNDKQTLQVFTPTLASTNVFGSFDATSTLVKADAIPATDLVNNYTVECWANLGDAPTFGRIFDKTNVMLFYQTQYSVYYPDNSFILSVTTASGSFTYYYPGLVNVGKWQHFALTVSSGNVYTLYIDGVAQTPSLIDGGVVGATKTNATIPLYIGNRADLTRGVKGYIDEFRIWNTELSQATIQTNMMTDYVGNEANLIAYYKFKEGNGNYLYDYSSNDNTAIITATDVSGVGAGMFWNEPGNLLTAMNVTGEKVPTTFDASTNAFTTIMDAANLSSIAPNFTTLQSSVVKVGTDVQVSGVTTHDFSSVSTLTYTVEGYGFNTGIVQTYTLNVTNDLSSDCELTAVTFEPADNSGLSSQIVLDANGNNFSKKLTYGMDVTALKARFVASANAKVFIDEVEQTSPQTTAIDYSKPLIVTIMAENGRVFKNYTIDLDTRNNEAQLTAFNIVDEQVGTADINTTNHTVAIWVNGSANLSMLTSNFTASTNAKVYVNSITQMSGMTVNDFTKPLVYTVVSEDGTTSTNWIVSVSNDETKPVITLLGDATVNLVYGSTYTDAGATATDNVDGDITAAIVSTSTVNTSLVGSYTIKYNVANSRTIAAVEVIRTVNITKATASINVSSATYTYDGTAKTVTISTNPVGLTVDVYYAGSTTAPIYAGKYPVVAIINNGNYCGTQVDTLSIVKAAAIIDITNLTQPYDGNAKPVTITTTPSGLNVDVTYDGSTTVPVNTGTYAVVATINDANYVGSSTATLTITPSTGIAPDDLNRLKIYSNSKVIFIEIPAIDGAVNLGVYNILGNLLYTTTNLTQGLNRIEGNFISGTYIVKVMIGDKCYTQKVVLLQ